VDSNSLGGGCSCEQPGSGWAGSGPAAPLAGLLFSLGVLGRRRRERAA